MTGATADRGAGEMTDAFERYAEYRQWGEDPGCAALRLRLDDADASRYEDAYQRIQEGRAA